MSTESSESTAKLGGLQVFLRRARAFGGQIVEATQYREDDHFAFMATAFLSRQIGHARALLLLEEHCDTQLIARSMAEGMCQLFWAHHDRPARALRWRQFSVVVDWRLMRESEAEGKTIPASIRSSIEARLAQDGAQFLKRSLGERKAGKELTSDPYIQDWTGLSVRALFREAEADLLYLKLYRPYAAWHHWSPQGIGQLIERREGVLVLPSSAPAVAAGAVALGFQCVIESARLLDLHLSLQLGNELRSLRDEYTEWHREDQGRKTRR